MSTTLQFTLLIGLLILAAKAGGLAASRLGQPAVLGELVAGLLLGPSVLNLLGQPPFAGSSAGETVQHLGDLGAIFLMFTVGLEADLTSMRQTGRAALYAGMLGVVVPLVLGTGAALLFGFSAIASVFIGLVLTATSVSISAQTMLDMNLLRSKEGAALLGAAVIDDVLGILLLSLFAAFMRDSGTGASSLAQVALHISLYFTIAIAFGIWVLPHLSVWVSRLPVSEGVLAFVIVIALFYAWTAESFGEIAAITGAFIAGALVGRTHLRHEAAEGMRTLAYAFFVPLFLVGIGLKADVHSLGEQGWIFAAVIIVVAVAAKFIGCYLGARLGGMNLREAVRVGTGMISRGEVGLIIATIGLQGGWINQSVYSTTLVMVLATTLATPVLLRMAFSYRGAVADTLVEPTAGSG